MKLLTALLFFTLSFQVLAITPFSFHCTTGSDGSCQVTNENATPMQEISEGVYGGIEGDYKLFYEKNAATNTSYMFIYKDQTMVAQSEGARYMAIATADGFIGIVLVE